MTCLGDKWQAPASTPDWQLLAERVLATNRNSSSPGYENAMQQQVQNFPIANFQRSADETILTMTVPSFPFYRLPALGSEYFEPVVLPGGVFNANSAISLKLGVSNLTVEARTAVYSGTFFGAQKLDEALRSSALWTVVIDLVAETWANDTISNPVKRQALIDTVLGSSRGNNSWSEQKYERALAVRRQNFPASSMIIVNGTQLTITIPPLSEYELPGGGSESITPGIIPHQVLAGRCCPIASNFNMPLQAGTRSVEIIPRTAVYSGSFFMSETTSVLGQTSVSNDISGFGSDYKTDENIQALFKTDENMILTPDYKVNITLKNDTWATDIVSNPAKKLALVNAVLTSSVSVSENSKGITGSTTNVTNTNFTVLELITPNQLTLTILPLPHYFLPRLGFEVVGATNLPHVLLSSTTDLTAKLGKRSIWLRARTAKYSGTFFSSNKTDENIQLSTTYTVEIELAAAIWHPDVATNATKRQALVDRVLATTYGPTLVGMNPYTYEEATAEAYKDALHKQRQDYPTYGVFRDDATHLRVVVVQLPKYKIPAGGRERVQALALPASSVCEHGTVCSISGARLDLDLQTGLVWTYILARTVHFSGTFFNNEPKQDSAIRRGANLTVVLDLLSDSWVSNVATDPAQRQGLINSVFRSSNSSFHPDFTSAFEYQRQNWPASGIARVSDTRVIITIPSFPSYQLPGCAIETVSGDYVLNMHVEGLTPIINTLGNKVQEVNGQVSPPTFTPLTVGPHITSVTVSIHVCSDGRGISATAYYSLDGSAPTVEYKGPFQVYRIQSIRAIGRKSGHTASAESSMNYTVKAAAPVLCPPPGEYAGFVEQITINSATPDVNIFYTVDGQPASESSPQLSRWSSFDWLQPGVVTIRAIAARAGVLTSENVSFVYNITSGTIPESRCLSPQFGILGKAIQGGGVVTQGTTLDISVPQPDDDATIYWTAHVGSWTDSTGNFPLTCEKSYDYSGGTWKTALSGRVSVQLSVAAGRNITIKALAKKAGRRISAIAVGSFIMQQQNQFEVRTAHSKLAFKAVKPSEN